MIDISDRIGRIDREFCDDCKTYTRHQLIYIKQYSSTDSYEGYEKCLICGCIKFSYTAIMYPDELDDVWDFTETDNNDYLFTTITESSQEDKDEPNEIKPKQIKIETVQMNSEIYSCLVCDDICGLSALKEGIQVIFHICFNCMTLFQEGFFTV